MVLGTVLVVLNHSQSRATRAREHPADPLSDAQASGQVVNAVLDVVRAAHLRNPAGGYSFQPCANAVGPPFHAVVNMTFTLPQGNSVEYLNGVAAAMVGLGWAEADTRAEHFGKKLTNAELTSMFHRNPERRDVATMRVYGDCRVVTDHRADDPAWIELTDRLRAPA